MPMHQSALSVAQACGKPLYNLALRTATARLSTALRNRTFLKGSGPLGGQTALPSSNNRNEQVRYYSEEVHDHFRDPRNVGSLDSSDPSVGTAIVGKASCGDVIKLQVKVKDEKIEDVKFKAFGCGSAIASSSFASELIKGKTCDEALAVKNIDIANHLSLPPVKIHCSLLAEDAVRHAIHNFRMKNKSQEAAVGPSE